MKSRWLLISVLLAFPIAFGFFLSEARLGDKRPAKPAPVVSKPLQAPVSAPLPPVETPAESPLPQSPQTKTQPASSEATAAASPPPTPPIQNRESKIENLLPLLVEGTVTKEGNDLVYESDAKLQLANNVFLSSPTGVMVSDEQQKIFAGDMQLLTTQQTISADEAVLKIQPDGGSVLTTKTLSVSSNDNSQPAMEIKGENVTLTLPAKKSPAPPLVPAVPSGATDLAPSASAP